MDIFTVVQVTWVLGLTAVIVLERHLRVCVGTRVRETGPSLRHAARGTRRGCRGQHGEERGRAVAGAGPGRTRGRSGRRQHGGQWFAVLGGHQGAGGGYGRRVSGVGEGSGRGEAEGEGGEERAVVGAEPDQGEGRPERQRIHLDFTE